LSNALKTQGGLCFQYPMHLELGCRCLNNLKIKEVIMEIRKYFEFHFISLFLWHWSLNSGLRTCYSGILPLDPHSQLFFALVIFQVGSHAFA
jgi:hypothetical protein